ncbi:MAG: hypothetical protein M3Y76_12680 [Chloroflexota bacterium]|nr:hypothetical protein [Chloroflexota bacterium]
MVEAQGEVLRCDQDAGDHKGPHPSTTPPPPLRMGGLFERADEKPTLESTTAAPTRRAQESSHSRG